MKKRALFITFEGPEGSGKSTQLRLLSGRLRSSGWDVVETREPGGTPIGTQIRSILLDANNRDLCPAAELMLLLASRAQNVDQCILPALASERIVLSDRFTDSTLAYQGAGRGLPPDTVQELAKIACRGLMPDLTLLIDIDTQTGLTRARARNELSGGEETRIDEEAFTFHVKVRDAFREIAAKDPRRVRLIDGSLRQEVVAEYVWNAVERFLFD